MRKIIVIATIALVLVLANIIWLTRYLAEKDVIDLAIKIKTEYLTGTALAVILALLILLPDRFKRRSE